MHISSRGNLGLSTAFAVFWARIEPPGAVGVRRESQPREAFPCYCSVAHAVKVKKR